MSTFQGKIQEVSWEYTTIRLEQDALTGSSNLIVDDTSDLLEEGGTLRDPDTGTVYTYITVNYEDDVVTLAAPLAADLLADTDLTVLPESQEMVATVTADDFADAVQIKVPHALQATIDTGLRGEGEEESILFEDDGQGEYVIREIIAESYRLRGVQVTEIRTADDGTAHILLGGTGTDNFAQWVDASGEILGAISSGEGSSGSGWIMSGPLNTNARNASIIWFAGNDVITNVGQTNGRTIGGFLSVRAGQMRCAVPWVLGQDTDGSENTISLVEDGSPSGANGAIVNSSGNFKLAAGWSSVSGQTVRYYYDAAGRVEFRGAINRGTHASGDVVTILHTRHRPATTFYGVVRSPSTATDCTIQVTSDGLVRAYWNGTAPGTIGMDFSFSTLM